MGCLRYPNFRMGGVWNRSYMKLQLDGLYTDRCRFKSYFDKSLDIWRSEDGKRQRPTNVSLFEGYEGLNGGMERGIQFSPNLFGQWEFRDHKMEVLYHIRPYFGWIFPH